MDSVSPVAIAERVASWSPDAKLSKLPVGHFPMIEDPQEWANVNLLATSFVYHADCTEFLLVFEVNQQRASLILSCAVSPENGCLKDTIRSVSSMFHCDERANGWWMMQDI